jgi:TRAP-type uncharacterized transport system substrate-binding protein
VLLIGAGAGTAALTATAAAWATGRDDRPAADEGPAELRLATGPSGGVYRVIGGELVAALAERLPRSHVTEIPTGASVDNLALLAANGAELAFAYLDATVAAWPITGPRTSAPWRASTTRVHVIVVASVYPDIADLDSRR